jgi:DNA-binding transcriptional ArsR family regulator
MPGKPATNIDDPRHVRALSHPLRVRILALLQERTASPSELTDWLDASLGTVSYHVRTLHDSGLIELVGTKQVRGAIEHYYRANTYPRVSDDAWAAATPIVKQAAIGAELQTVDDYASAAAAAGGFDRGEAHLSRTSLRLDARGWQQAAKACERMLAELGRVEEAAAKRMTTRPDPDGTSDAELVVMLFDGRQPTQPARGARAARRSAKRPSAG